MVAEKQYPDIQWRYDKLNDLIAQHYGRIDSAMAWRLINFLSADAESFVPDYYRKNPDFTYTDSHGNKKKTKQIGGSTSLCNLTDLTIKSRYGYYADEPVNTTLKKYLIKT